MEENKKKLGRIDLGIFEADFGRARPLLLHLKATKVLRRCTLVAMATVDLSTQRSVSLVLALSTVSTFRLVSPVESSRPTAVSGPFTQNLTL